MSDINLSKIGWQNGTLVSKAKVEIGGTIYEVDPEEYSGATPLSAENLIQMEINTEIAINEVNDKLEDAVTYAATETVIGTFLGKPLYQQVIKKNITTNSVYGFAHNIANVDKIWLAGDSFLDVSGTSLPLNYFRNGTDNNIYAHADASNLTIKIGPSGWINHDAYFFVRYTKTTD